MYETKPTRRAFITTAVLFTPASLALRKNWFPGSSDFLPLWHRAKQYTLACLVAMPPEFYEFKPNATVRSFAEQAMHIAQVNVFLASQLLGENSLLETDGEIKGKLAVISAVTSAFDHVASAIESATTAQLEQVIELGQASVTGRELLYLIRDHVTHHRGQMVAYLRQKDIEPPQYVGF